MDQEKGAKKMILFRIFDFFDECHEFEKNDYLLEKCKSDTGWHGKIE